MRKEADPYKMYRGPIIVAVLPKSYKLPVEQKPKCRCCCADRV
jgi:hypothetical protein